MDNGLEARTGPWAEAVHASLTLTNLKLNQTRDDETVADDLDADSSDQITTSLSPTLASAQPGGIHVGLRPLRRRSGAVGAALHHGASKPEDEGVKMTIWKPMAEAAELRQTASDQLRLLSLTGR